MLSVALRTHSDAFTDQLEQLARRNRRVGYARAKSESAVKPRFIQRFACVDLGLKWQDLQRCFNLASSALNCKRAASF